MKNEMHTYCLSLLTKKHPVLMQNSPPRFINLVLLTDDRILVCYGDECICKLKGHEIKQAIRLHSYGDIFKNTCCGYDLLSIDDLPANWKENCTLKRIRNYGVRSHSTTPITYVR